MKTGGYGTKETGKSTVQSTKMPGCKPEFGKGVRHLEKNLNEKDRPLDRDRMRGDVRSA